MEPRSLAYQSGTLTITPECLLCLCEAIIEPYSCLGDSAQFIEFIEFNENLFILEKTRMLPLGGSHVCFSSFLSQVTSDLS